MYANKMFDIEPRRRDNNQKRNMVEAPHDNNDYWLNLYRQVINIWIWIWWCKLTKPRTPNIKCQPIWRMLCGELLVST